MTRGGRKTRPETPERRCIATGASGPTARLVRFAVAPDGSVVPDVAEKLPGRGIWVSADRGALDKAAAKGLFARSAKRAVTCAPDLADRVEAALARQVVDLLSLSRKAGAAVAGFEKTKDWLEKGRAAVLLQAADGSGRGKSKLWPPEPENPGDETFIGCLTAREIGLAFGREHVIHAALAAGGLTARVARDAARLSGVRRQIGGDAAGKDMTDA